MIHQAAAGEEIIPVEIDLTHVRRQREAGTRCLGQMLKSFRDRKVDFTVYDRAAGVDAYLHTLGPLVMPGKGAPHRPDPDRRHRRHGRHRPAHGANAPDGQLTGWMEETPT